MYMYMGQFLQDGKNVPLTFLKKKYSACVAKPNPTPRIRDSSCCSCSGTKNTGVMVLAHVMVLARVMVLACV